MLHEDDPAFDLVIEMPVSLFHEGNFDFSETALDADVELIVTSAIVLDQIISHEEAQAHDDFVNALHPSSISSMVRSRVSFGGVERGACLSKRVTPDVL